MRSRPLVGIVSYGLGNIEAYTKIFKKLGVNIVRVESPADCLSVTHFILPGVGSFDSAIDRFTRSGLRKVVEEMVLGDKIPLLGVCIGMHMLFSGSEEGIEPGLDWIKGNVTRLDAVRCGEGKTLPVPHMGWNTVTCLNDSTILKSLEKSEFYFLHSYKAVPISQKVVVGETDYGNTFASVVKLDNIFGVQFHPERSHSFGQNLLKNFVEFSDV